MPQQNKQTQNRELHQTLIEINRHLKRLASYRHNLLMSILRGLGFAVGSTIVLAVFLAIIIRITSVLLSNSQFFRDMSTQMELLQQIPNIQNYENQIYPSGR